MNRIIVRLLLFFYLTSGYLSATHIHHDTLASHADCKICMVVKNLHSGDTPLVFEHDIPCNGCYEPIAFEVNRLQHTMLKGFNAQAPPKHS